MKRNEAKLANAVHDTVEFIKSTFTDNVKKVRMVQTQAHGKMLNSAYITIKTNNGVKKIRVSDHRSHLLKANEFALEVAVAYRPSKGIYQHTDTMGIINAMCRM